MFHVKQSRRRGLFSARSSGVLASISCFDHIPSPCVVESGASLREVGGWLFGIPVGTGTLALGFLVHRVRLSAWPAAPFQTVHAISRTRLSDIVHRVAYAPRAALWRPVSARYCDTRVVVAARPAGASIRVLVRHPDRQPKMRVGVDRGDLVPEFPTGSSPSQPSRVHAFHDGGQIGPDVSPVSHLPLTCTNRAHGPIRRPPGQVTSPGHLRLCTI